ncbi:MAG TPA: hypothetical protein VIG06_22885 [Kofleriaceae bacterium]|jgi:hypothetical protein
MMMKSTGGSVPQSIELPLAVGPLLRRFAASSVIVEFDPAGRRSSPSYSLRLDEIQRL